MLEKEKLESEEKLQELRKRAGQRFFRIGFCLFFLLPPLPPLPGGKNKLHSGPWNRMLLLKTQIIVFCLIPYEEHQRRAAGDDSDPLHQNSTAAPFWRRRGNYGNSQRCNWRVEEWRREESDDECVRSLHTAACSSERRSKALQQLSGSVRHPSPLQKPSIQTKRVIFHLVLLWKRCQVSINHQDSRWSLLDEG